MKKLKDGYTTSDIARLGVKRERLKEWMKRHPIIPSVRLAVGSGTRNLFSEWDLRMILLFKTLLEHGFSGSSAFTIIQIISNIHNGPIPEVAALPEKDQDRARRKHIDLKKQTDKDFLAFFKRPESDERPTAVFWGFNRKDDKKELDQLMSEYSAVVIVNFKKIRNQINKLA